MNKKLLDLSDIKKGLSDRRLYKVAEVTGLSYPTLKKLANGDGSTCNMSTIQTVSDYLTGSWNTKERRERK